MREMQLLKRKRAKSKSKFRNQFKTYNKLLREVKSNIAINTKQRVYMTNKLEVDIVLACCNALKYLLIAVILSACV